MRQIETKPTRSVLSRERRFSVLSIGKLQAGWSLMQIPAEQLTEQAARHDEAIPVIHEMKSVRSGLLLLRKRRLQLAKILLFAVERRMPHVDFVPDLFPFR